MYSNFLQTCITESTRIVSANRPSFVDNIFINIIDKNLYRTNSQIIFPILLYIIENMNKKPSKQKIKMRDTTHFTLEKYPADLKDLYSVLQQEFSSVNDTYNIHIICVIQMIPIIHTIFSKKD